MWSRLNSWLWHKQLGRTPSQLSLSNSDLRRCVGTDHRYCAVSALFGPCHILFYFEVQRHPRLPAKFPCFLCDWVTLPNVFHLCLSSWFPELVIMLVITDVQRRLSLVMWCIFPGLFKDQTHFVKFPITFSGFIPNNEKSVIIKSHSFLFPVCSMKHKCQQNQMKHDDNSLTGTFHFSLAVWVSERWSALASEQAALPLKCRRRRSRLV